MKDGAVALTAVGFVVLVVIATFVAFYRIGWDGGERDTRQAAVNAGVAEWTVDSKGVKGFRWLSPAESK